MNMMDTIDYIIKFCENSQKENDRMGYALYLEFKKNSSIICNFYAVLDRYAKCCHRDTGIVPEKEFCILRELTDLIQNNRISDVIEFIDSKKAYKQAFFVGDVFLESEHRNTAILIQAYSFIGAGDASGERNAREMLQTLLVDDIVLKDKFSDAWLEDLETKKLFYVVKWYIAEREFLASKFMRKEFL